MSGTRSVACLRPAFDIAEVVRGHRAALEERYALSPAQGRVLSAIERCRTAALGGHLDLCRACGREHPVYNSCRNRHCPKCQALAQERWIAARSRVFLPIPHFHVVFTLPSELRTLARVRPCEVFNALFGAASEALLELGKSRLGARLGVTMVLHTWTRDLRFHPHVHALVSAGGLSLERSSWRPASKKYLFPVKVIGALLRGEMLARLSHLVQAGVFDGTSMFSKRHHVSRWFDELARKSWVVYAKRPFQTVKHVLRYLGRYTHRVAISNSRIVNFTPLRVVLRTKHGRVAAMEPVEFLRRFVAHVLPHRFHKIRHYGLYAGASGETRDEAEEQCTNSVKRREAVAEAEERHRDWPSMLLTLTGRDVRRCASCGGEIEQRPLPTALSEARGPPHGEGGATS